MHRSLGIDLGTTNSVVASNAQVLPLHEGDERAFLLPSVVAFLPGGGALVGESARQRRPIDPGHTIYSSKRLMGESWTSYAARQFRDQYPHQLAPAPDGGVQFVTRAGRIAPSEAASLIVSHLCARTHLDLRAAHAVVTVPSSFREPARKATVWAVQRAGIQEVRLIEEPVATAIPYLQRASLRYAAVYDLGGGTFDFAVVDCASFPFRVLGHGGDAYLGGDDVDRALAEMLAQEVLRETGWDLASDPMIFARLTFMVEQAKRALSLHREASVDLREIDPAAPPGLTRAVIRRDMLEAAATPQIRRTFAICDHVLSEVGLRARDIQAVFLAGGGTRLPNLPAMLAQYFRRKLRSDLNPEHVVAVGASLAAARPALWSLLDGQ